MNEVSKAESVRAIGADTSRKDAAAAFHTASKGQADGKELPDSLDRQGSSTPQQTATATAAPARRMDEAVQSLNDFAQSFQRDLEFSVDEDLGRAIVQVVDRNTQEVIRQIPSDVALRLARNLQLQQDVAMSNAPERVGEGFGAGDRRLGLVDTTA